MPRLNPLLDQLAEYPMVELERRKRAVAARGLPLYDFSVGDPVEPTPLFIRQALKDGVKPRCGYPSIAGTPGLRGAIADYLGRRFDVEVNPDTQILPTAGAKEAVFHTPLLVIDPAAEDKAVVFPDPGYPAYQRGVLFAGGEAVAVPLSGDHIFRPWLLPAELLRRTRMIWLNTPHNPSGAVTDLDDLRRAVDVAQRYDIVLVCDEAYADIYHDAPPPSLLQAGTQGVLVLHSLSKRSGMTGYRSGFLAGDPALIARLRRLRSNPGLASPDFVNAAAQAAWSDDGHVVQRRDLFRAKRQALLDFFDQIGIDVHLSQATIYLWVRVPAGFDDESWAAALLDHGVVVSPGRMFGVNGAGRGYVRLALVPSLDDVRAAITVLRGVLG
ncbi:MAG: aminotransferase class I/II-fold pyridoxal phosphate-dependent enzyme [Oligoflexia bacterium]|nr:aminotransferase class I/II-fold pyridoxal phosphate-dependent enzyme [Oligoflexia bacterium]